jgi:hypothetical protein
VALLPGVETSEQVGRVPRVEMFKIQVKRRKVNKISNPAGEIAVHASWRHIDLGLRF